MPFTILSLTDKVFNQSKTLAVAYSLDDVFEDLQAKVPHNGVLAFIGQLQATRHTERTLLFELFTELLTQ